MSWWSFSGKINVSAEVGRLIFLFPTDGVACTECQHEFVGFALTPGPKNQQVAHVPHAMRVLENMMATFCFLVD